MGLIECRPFRALDSAIYCNPGFHPGLPNLVPLGPLTNTGSQSDVRTPLRSSCRKFLCPRSKPISREIYEAYRNGKTDFQLMLQDASSTTKPYIVKSFHYFLITPAILLKKLTSRWLVQDIATTELTITISTQVGVADSFCIGGWNSFAISTIECTILHIQSKR